jgi:putative flippase GtrA
MFNSVPSTLRILKRWIVFNSVGAIGILVQLSVLTLLISKLKVNYLPATGMAVETAVLHNFFWHENWTWADRAKGSQGGFWRRIFYFHLTNGVLSLIGNIILMRLFIQILNWNYIQANAAAIAACSIFNFLAGDLFVYRTDRSFKSTGGKMSKNSLTNASAVLFLSTVIFLFSSSIAAAAELQPETLKAWSDYVRAVETRINSELSSKEKFLSLDFKYSSKAAQERQALLSGNILIEKVAVDSDSEREIPDGMIQHWRGFIFIPGVNLDSVLYRVENPTAEDMKQEDVKDSRVLEKTPGQLKLYLKLQRKKIVTVVYSTEHLIQYWKCSDSKAWSSSVATRIREIESIEGKAERERPEGHDSGFLWKLNSYWRYQQVDGGVIVECESMTLSRSVPAILSPIANPLIKSVARESMQRTLQSFRTRMTRTNQQSAAIAGNQNTQ